MLVTLNLLSGLILFLLSSPATGAFVTLNAGNDCQGGVYFTCGYIDAGVCCALPVDSWAANSTWFFHLNGGTPTYNYPFNSSANQCNVSPCSKTAGDNCAACDGGIGAASWGGTANNGTSAGSVSVSSGDKQAVIGGVERAELRKREVDSREKCVEPDFITIVSAFVYSLEFRDLFTLNIEHLRPFSTFLELVNHGTNPCKGRPPLSLCQSSNGGKDIVR